MCFYCWVISERQNPHHFKKGDQYLKEQGPNSNTQENFYHLMSMNQKFPVNTKHANEIDYRGSIIIFIQAILII